VCSRVRLYPSGRLNVLKKVVARRMLGAGEIMPLAVQIQVCTGNSRLELNNALFRLYAKTSLTN